MSEEMVPGLSPFMRDWVIPGIVVLLVAVVLEAFPLKLWDRLGIIMLVWLVMDWLLPGAEETDEVAE